MKKLLKIQLSIDKEVFAECHYLQLDPYATGTARKFTFKNLSIKKKVIIQRDHSIRVSILHSNCFLRKKIPLVAFSMLIFKTQDKMEKNWWAYGLIETAYEEEYRQGVIEIFNMWQNNLSINWSSLLIGDPLKEDYLYSCLKYTSLSKTIREQDTYFIDMNQIQEEADFLYWVSHAFLGERGYMGYCLFTFEDCLLEIFHHRGSFADKQVVFLNTHNLYNMEVKQLYETVKKIFLKYQFVIQES